MWKISPYLVENDQGNVFELYERKWLNLDKSWRNAIVAIKRLGGRVDNDILERTLTSFGKTISEAISIGVVTTSTLDSALHHFKRAAIIETTTNCTASCVFCPVSTNPRRPPRFMSDDVFAKILKQLRGLDLRFVCLNLYTEALAHPNFLEQAKLIKDYGWPLAIFTTGTLLKPDISRQLAVLGHVYTITVNMASADPAEYRKMMGVGMSKKLDENLMTAIDAGLPVQFCVNGTTYSHERTKEILNKFSNDKSMVSAFMNLTHSRAGFVNNSEILPLEKHGGALAGCRRLVEDITVNVDGDVLLCCEDFHQSFKFGNLLIDDLEKILMSKEALRTREKTFGKITCGTDFICRSCAELWRGRDDDIPIAKLV